MRSKLINGAGQFGAALLTILAAMLVGSVLILVSGNNPIEVYGVLWNGAFGSGQRVSETLVKTIPLTIMALGVSIAFKAQLWNIGGNGQFIMGGFLSIVAGLYLPLPNFLLFPISILCGMLGGALWAGVAGWIKVRFNGNEVITTLMLNYIAAYFLSWLVNGPMKDPAGYDFPQTPLINEGLRLPLFVPEYRVHVGIFFAIALVVLMVFFWRSTLGFRIDLVGQGRQVSQYAGIGVNRTMMISMLLSGALVGLAGWNEVYGVQYRLLEGLASGYGNLAVVIALLGGLHPLGVCVAAFFFSGLMTGGATMQRMTDIPYAIVDIIQGLVIVFVIARVAFQYIKKPQKKLKEGGEHA